MRSRPALTACAHGLRSWPALMARAHGLRSWRVFSLSHVLRSGHGVSSRRALKECAQVNTLDFHLEKLQSFQRTCALHKMQLQKRDAKKNPNRIQVLFLLTTLLQQNPIFILDCLLQFIYIYSRWENALFFVNLQQEIVASPKRMEEKTLAIFLCWI